MAYSEGEEYRSTAVVDRVRLRDDKVTAREWIFTADAYSEGLYHFASGMAFVDGYLYLALGDREHPPMAQDNTKHAGTIVRLHDDGRVPSDNPFVGATAPEGTAPPRPEIWSFGHRDPQGLYRHPTTGESWSHEHGPRGGDEINLVKKGANYGWPVVSYGLQYDGGPIDMGIPVQEGMEVPAWVYVPSIAPSDLVIYQGKAFPAWQGRSESDLLVLVGLARAPPRGRRAPGPLSRGQGMSALAPTLQAFFTDRLVRQRQASPHTLAAYRDTMRLLVCFATARRGVEPAKLDIDDLDATVISAFLDHRQHDQGNSIRTRNARLAAIRSLFRFAALRHPEQAAGIGRVLAIPPKRFERRLVTFLTEPEVDALLAAPARTTWTGRRDHALLALAVQTGLRVSELIALRKADVHLGVGPHVSCLGKGRKHRITPLTAPVVAVLRSGQTIPPGRR